ncbi:hypothetical protein [Cellulomonas endophytica]|uniref:hypothetical protein n=1 Tax=Cellulomonas endophytica TaxID=2494735 RepID=UPI0013E9297C|nr:hypothetical protein [Cellulomonas endophytica]
MTIASMASGALGMRFVVAGHVAAGDLEAPAPTSGASGAPATDLASLDPALGRLLDALA